MQLQKYIYVFSVRTHAVKFAEGLAIILSEKTEVINLIYDGIRF